MQWRILKRVWCIAVILSVLTMVALPTAQGQRIKPSSLYRMTILGTPVASKEQCVKYLLRVNPKPAISVSPRQLVDHYYDEAAREGIRPDIAFAQALHETGNFRFGGAVRPGQNNFCGLGSVHSSANGARFESPQIGVRAHVQHLLGYASNRPPRTAIVDPRYNSLKKSRNFGRARTWQDLNGKWAVPGRDYAQKIMNIYGRILDS